MLKCSRYLLKSPSPIFLCSPSIYHTRNEREKVLFPQSAKPLFIVLFSFPPGELLLSCRRACFCVVWRLRLVRGVRACAFDVCMGECVTMRPRRPGESTRKLAAVSPWPSSALGYVEGYVALNGVAVSVFTAVAVCVSGCLLPTERRCFQPDDHLLLEVVGETPSSVNKLSDRWMAFFLSLRSCL